MERRTRAESVDWTVPCCWRVSRWSTRWRHETVARVPEAATTDSGESKGRRRNILFITTDQQRYDSLGCNGGTVARTPVVDRLAAEGINYRRAYNQNTVCMP